MWSPAKYFCVRSLWLIRQGIQITHIWKSHPFFPWEITAYKYLVLESLHFFIHLPYRELLGKVVRKFVSDSAVFCYRFFLTTEN